MFELRYDVKYSDEQYEYYDIYKDGKPYYKENNLSYILSLEISRCNKHIKFINVTDKIIDELLFDKHELYLLILSLYDELDIKGYKVINNNLLSNELNSALKNVIKKNN